MPRKNDAQQTGNIGVARVRLIVEEILRWEFREQNSGDFGLDAHFEIIDEHEVTGRLLGVQIKSGPSFFSEPTKAGDGFVFRESLDKLEYWTRHSLPVIVVLYDPGTQITYWAHVDRERVEMTGKQWKIIVPKSNVLSADSAHALRQLAEGPAWVQKMRRLSLAKPLMTLVVQGGSIQVEGTVFTNKTLPRVNLTMTGRAPDGSERHQETWVVAWPGGWPSDLLSRIYPWAGSQLEVEGVDDEEALCEELYEEIWNNDYGNYAEGEMFGHSADLSDVRDQYSDYDYASLLAMVRDPEGFTFSGSLQLNEVGKAFLTLEAFLSTSEGQS